MRVLVEMHFGSTVYGTRHSQSDTDLKAVCVPPAEDILLQSAKKSVFLQSKKILKEKNTASDTDLEIFSLQYFLDLVVQGQTAALEMLFTPRMYYTQESGTTWDFLQRNKDRLLSRKMSSFANYCRTQASKYSLKGERLADLRAVVECLQTLPPKDTLFPWLGLFSKISEQHKHVSIVETRNPKYAKTEFLLQVSNRRAQAGVTIQHALGIFESALQQYGKRAEQAELSQGVDWKALMHAVRIAQEGEELLRTGHLTLPRLNADFLLEIRAGNLSYEKVTELLESCIERLEDAFSTSHLPLEPDATSCRDVTLREYAQEVCSRVWK